MRDTYHARARTHTHARAHTYTCTRAHTYTPGHWAVSPRPSKRLRATCMRKATPRVLSGSGTWASSKGSTPSTMATTTTSASLKATTTAAQTHKWARRIQAADTGSTIDARATKPRLQTRRRRGTVCIGVPPCVVLVCHAVRVMHPDPLGQRHATPAMQSTPSSHQHHAPHTLPPTTSSPPPMLHVPTKDAQLCPHALQPSRRCRHELPPWTHQPLELLPPTHARV